MKITLISPFRTLLNLDTDRAFSNAGMFYQTLKKAAQQASKENQVTFTSNRTPPPERPFTKYTHLDQKYATWFTTPLATATLADSFIDAMEIFSEKNQNEEMQQTQKPTKAVVDIHDNTLAVMTLELDFDEALLNRTFSTPTEFETYLSTYAAACARYAEDHVIQHFIESLLDVVDQNKAWKGRKHLLHRPIDFVAFNDLRNHKFPAWNHDDEPSLWTHRVFHIEGITKAQIKQIVPLLRETKFPEGARYVIKQGTSYALEETSAQTLVNMNSTSQYFYCMVDALNYSQKRLMRKLANGGKGIKINKAYARYDRQENLLAEMKNEMLDFTTGLQGLAQDIFNDIQSAFRISELISTMEQRTDLLRNKLMRAARRKTFIQQRMLSFILILVGSIQVISLVIQIFGYTNDVKEDDRILGLTDLVQNIPFDLAISVVVLCLVVIALYWAIRHGYKAEKL